MAYTTDAEYLAPKGLSFVCGACGKHGPDRTRIGDESCFMNAILCRPIPEEQRILKGSARWEPVCVDRYPTIDQMNEAALRCQPSIP